MFIMANWKPIFVDPPSSHLYCPLCKDILKEPMISVACGHTFCRSCLCNNDSTLKISHCPIDENYIQDSHVVYNKAVLSQLEDLQVYCRNGIKRLNSRNDTIDVDNGCPDILPFLSAEKHDCKYNKIACPNEPGCGLFQKSSLADHLSEVCPHTSCPNIGCNYKNTLNNIRKHQMECPYFMLKLNELDAGNGSLQQMVTTLQHMVTALQQRVSDLEESKAAVTDYVQQQSSLVKYMDEKISGMQSDIEDNHKKLSSLTGRSRMESSESARNLARVHRLSSNLDGGYSRSQWHIPFEFKCIGTLSGHSGSVDCLAIHGHRLYSGGSDCIIKVWELEALSKGCIDELKGHSKKVVALVTSNKYLYSTAMDLSIKCWKYDGNNTEHLSVTNAHTQEICDLAMAGIYLFSSSHTEVKVWNADNLELVKHISGLHHWVRALALDPEREKLYCGSHNTVTVWDATGQFNLKRKLDHSFGSVYSIVISSQYLIIGTQIAGVQIFLVDSHLHIKSLPPVGTVPQLLLSPDRNFLLSSCSDSNVLIFNLENFLSLQVLSRHQGSVNALALRNGLLFSGSDDKEIKIFKYFSLTTHSSYGIHIRPGKDT